MSISNYTEAELIKQLHNGDGVAFAQLYKEYYDDLTFYTKKMVGDMEVATGIVSDAFGRLWKRRINFPSIANIRAFLYTTARNLAIDWLRRKDIRPDIPQSSILGELPESAVYPSIEAEMMKMEVYRLLNTALDQLEPEQRLILEKLFIQEKSIKEICIELGISQEVAYQRKSRALKKLKDQNRSWLNYFRRLNLSPIIFFL